MHPFVRPTTSDDIAYVAANMRTEDVNEVRAASGSTPLTALQLGSAFSTAPLTLIDPHTGRVGGILGVVPEDDLTGRIWMLGTPLIEEVSMTFLRRCQVVVKGLNQVYPILTNKVDERNEVHIKWLRWLGFKFIRRVPEHGVERRPFIEFVRVQDV